METSFIAGDAYTKAVRDVFASSGRIDAAVAFWGADAELMLQERGPSTSIRLVCNLASGACNPRVIRQLRDANYQIKTFASLHAKVVLADDFVLVGSANLSANGLSLEGDAASGWLEAGTRCSSHAVRAEAADWFETLWHKAERITDAALERAAILWNRRRIDRPVDGTALMANLPRSQLEGRNVWLAVYRDQASDAAWEKMEEIRNSAAPGGVGQGILDFWEDWPELPDGGATLVSVYFGPKGRVKVEGAYVRIPKLDATTRDGTSLQVVTQAETVLGRSFGAQETEALEAAIRPHVRAAWKAMPAGHLGVLMTLEDAVHGPE